MFFSDSMMLRGFSPSPPPHQRGGGGHPPASMYVHSCLSLLLRHSYIRIWASQRPSFHPYSSVPSPGCLSQIPDYGSGSQSLPIPDPGSRTPEPKVTKEGSSVFSKKCWFFSHKLPESSQVYRFGIRDSGPEAHKPEYHIQGPPPAPPPAGMIPPPPKRGEGGEHPRKQAGGQGTPSLESKTIRRWVWRSVHLVDSGMLLNAAAL